MEYRVISADNHIIEAPNTFSDRLPNEFKDRAPRILRGEDGGDGWSFDGKPPKSTFGLNAVAGLEFENYKSSGIKFEEILPGNYDGAAHIKDMASDGIDAAVIYPFSSLQSYLVPDRRFGVALLQAYNDWLVDEFCAAGPDQLIGLALMPVDDGIDVLVNEATRVIGKGAKGLFIPYYSEVPYYSTQYDPFWKVAADAGVPVSLHRSMGGAAKAGTGTAGIAAPPGLNISGIVERFFTAITPFSQLVFTGLFERFPSLKLVHAEVNAGWLPFWLQMMDQEFERQRHWAHPPLSTSPSDFVGKNLFVTVLDDYVGFGAARDNDLFASAAMYSTDYPHSVTLYPHSREYIQKLTVGMSDESKSSILAGNAIRVFNLNPSAR